MNIRKILNIPTTTQSLMIKYDIENIIKNCDIITKQELKEQKENQKSHDDRCPNCRAMKNDIVDKISSVEGKGNVGGDFYLGFGSVKGSINIDTLPVNHCNKCQHEWKKFKTKFISKTDILKVSLNYLAEIINDPEGNKKFKWKREAIQIFNKCHAESIRGVYNKNKLSLRILTQNTLKTRRLRKYFPSIFDGNNNKELKKI